VEEDDPEALLLLEEEGDGAKKVRACRFVT
jgi:hypothetical protein